MGRAHHVRRERRSRRLSARRPSGAASFGLFVSRVWRGALGVAALLALGTAVLLSAAPALLALGTAVLLSAAPAEAQTAVKLVGNTGQTQNNVGAGFHNDFAQAFTTGANAGGYKLTRVDLRLRNSSNISPSYSVKIFSNSSGSPGSSLGTLTNPSSLTGSGSFQNFQFTASSDGIDLAASTTYFVVVAVSVEANAVSVGTTLSDSEDTGAAAGWSIANNGLFRAINSTDSWTSSTSARMIAVYGYAKGGTTTKPAKPTDFAATGVELGLRLTWSDPGDSSIVKYQYRISATASWTAWTDIAGSSATTTGYTVENLPVRTFGTPFRVQLRAVNVVGNGVQSDVVSAAPTLPAIAGLSASPGSDRVTLTWTNPASCAEAEALHGLAGAAVGAGTVRHLHFLLDPPVRQGRVLADEADELCPALQHAQRAVSGVGGNAEIEGLALPPVEDVGLAHPALAVAAGHERGALGQLVLAALAVADELEERRLNHRHAGRELLQVDEVERGAVRGRQKVGGRPAGMVVVVAPGDAAQVDGVEEQGAHVVVGASAFGGDLLRDLALAAAGSSPDHHGLSGFDKDLEGGGELAGAKRVIGGDRVWVGHGGIPAMKRRRRTRTARPPAHRQAGLISTSF